LLYINQTLLRRDLSICWCVVCPAYHGQTNVRTLFINESRWFLWPHKYKSLNMMWTHQWLSLHRKVFSN